MHLAMLSDIRILLAPEALLVNHTYLVISKIKSSYQCKFLVTSVDKSCTCPEFLCQVCTHDPPS